MVLTLFGDVIRIEEDDFSKSIYMRNRVSRGDQYNESD